MSNTALLERPQVSAPVPHRPSLLPRVAAVGMVLVGAAFIALTLIVNLFTVGPAFERMTDGFRPLMTQQAIQADRQDLAGISAAATEFDQKFIPAMAASLKVTPAQAKAGLAAQFPAVATGMAAIPQLVPSFTGVVNTLDQNRHVFASADAIPTKNMPATTLPWTLLAVGIIGVGLGVWMWFRPRAAGIVTAVLGVVLIVVPLVLTMPHKASDADQLNANLKPVYNQQLVTQANAGLATLSAMGTQMQEGMLPVLAQQLNMPASQVQPFLAQNFPAIAKALQTMPASLGRFQNLVGTFGRELSDYNTLKPVAMFPIAWMMIGGGIAMLLLGAGAVGFTGRREHPATTVAKSSSRILVDD